MVVRIDVGEPYLITAEQIQIEHFYIMGGTDNLSIASLAADKTAYQLADD